MAKFSHRINFSKNLFYVFFIFLMETNDFATNAEIINPSGIWKNSRGMVIKFDNSSNDNNNNNNNSNELSAMLFIKSKGFFNLTGIQSASKENGTFYLNSVKSSYVIGIAGQFLSCQNGIQQLQVALQFASNTKCNYDLITHSSIHTFYRASHSLWLTLQPECPSFQDKTNLTQQNYYRHDNDQQQQQQQQTDEMLEEINCTLNGLWMNEYNSTMNLTLGFDGKITGVYHTKHEREEGTSGSGITAIEGWMGDNSVFTFSMIWNQGTSVTNLLGINRLSENGTCVLWTDFVLTVAQETCEDSWKFCILSSYSIWKQLE